VEVWSVEGWSVKVWSVKVWSVAEVWSKEAGGVDSVKVPLSSGYVTFPQVPSWPGSGKPLGPINKGWFMLQ